jgi:branched-chain amino acid transport system ATP-binding protein
MIDSKMDSSTTTVTESGIPPKEGVLACRDLSKSFGRVTASDDVSLSIGEGEWVSLIGPNGAGKTTLLNMLSGFYEPDDDEGRIFFDGEDITDVPAYQRARRGMGRTFQSVELFSGTVLDNLLTIRGITNRPNLLEAVLYYGFGSKIEAENQRFAEEILEYLELWEHRTADVEELPHGLRRRVDLARALALEPKILLLDEVMSGLSYDEKYDIVRFLMDLYEDEGLTILTIEHDMEVVTQVSDRLIVMQNGEVIARGDPDTVTNNPKVAEVYTEV